MGEANLVPGEVIEQGEAVCGVRVENLWFCSSAFTALGRGRAAGHSATELWDVLPEPYCKQSKSTLVVTPVRWSRSALCL